MIYDILPVNNYKGNNSATEFEFDFYIEDETQLKVYLYDKFGVKHLLQYEQDYSINEIQNKNGSYITFPLDTSSYEVLTDEQKISLELNLKACQLTQYGNSSNLNLSALENSFDYITRLIQILKRKIELCLKVEEISDNTPEEFLNSLNQTKIVADNSANEAKNYMLEAQNYMVESQNYADISLQHSNNSLASYLNAKSIEESIAHFETIENSITTGLAQKVDLNLNNAVLSSSFAAKVFQRLLPDYSKGIHCATLPYTAPNNGWIIGYINRSTTNAMSVTIDSATVAHEADDYCDVQCPILKGQVLSATTLDVGSDRNNLYFYPMKGN